MLYSVNKKLFNVLILAASLIISSGFFIETKSVWDIPVSVSIEQQNNYVNILVNAPKNTRVQFYMFNTDGRLVKQLDITGTKKFTIDQLSKGYYLYELFNKDERIKRGDIQIK